jgi:hypothetical protein
VGILRNAPETTNATAGGHKIGNAVLMFTFVLLLSLILGVPVWYLLGIGFSKVLAVALALASLQTLSAILDVAWYEIPLSTMELGLVVAVPVWLIFSTGFFAVLAVALVLGILIPWWMGEEGRRDYEQTRKKKREDRERQDRVWEEQRQQEATSRTAQQERLKQEQEVRDYRPDQQDDGARTTSNRIRELRAMPYKEYLRTPHWKRRRQHALRAAGYRCQACSNSLAHLDVHHNTYENLGEELDRDLIVLCRECHEAFHERR